MKPESLRRSSMLAVTTRTGTVMSCLAILSGVPADQAIAWVREHYNERAVETPWQRGWVKRFAGRLD